jgi:crossover junction endonuclease MUS81
MKIIIDNRESRLYQAIKLLINSEDKFKNIPIEIQNLELGDIVINHDNTDQVIFERKTVEDLLASIKDSRYIEQSYRLSGSDCPNHNIIYLIESSGNINIHFNKQTVYSSMFSLNFFKGFSVWRSMNIEESAYMIVNAVYKIQKEKKKAYYTPKINDKSEEKEEKTDEKIQASYSTVVCKSKKNANITPENFGEIILLQIPSVNSVTAIAVMNIYKTVNNLIDAIKENPDCLNEIKYKTSSGQMRKISKTCIQNINKFLLQ